MNGDRMRTAYRPVSVQWCTVHNEVAVHEFDCITGIGDLISGPCNLVPCYIEDTTE